MLNQKRLTLTSIVDTAVSSVGSPSAGSTYLNSTTSLGPDLAGKEVSSINNVDGHGVNSPFGTNSGPQTDLSPTQLSPSIPFRSSSQSNLQSSSVSPVTGQPSDEVKNPPLESKGNAAVGSRGGSIASSRHSRKVKKSPPNSASAAPADPNNQDPPATEKPKKKGFSKILSFFVCCVAPENANAADSGDQTVPARKTKVLQQMRGSQATPVVKPSASAADSSTGESKEVVSEGIGGPPYLEHIPAAKPKMQPQLEVPPAEKNTLHDDTLQNLNEKEEIVNTGTGTQMLSSLQNPNNSKVRDESPSQIQPIIPNTIATAEPLQPPKAPLIDENVAQQDIATNDGTAKQKQRDSDIEMVDAPPVVSVPNEQPRLPQAREESQQTNLPPPPPRNPQNQGIVGIGRSTSNATTSNEKQQSLLPPLQPRFKGKKCLVLDLDETLVHSSFKVCAPG